MTVDLAYSALWSKKCLEHLRTLTTNLVLHALSKISPGPMRVVEFQ